MSWDHEFSQRLHRHQDRQPAVLLNRQIAGDIDYRFGGTSDCALGVVEVESGTDWHTPHVHEHQIGGGAIPVGEMRKVQGEHFRRFRRGLGLVGNPARADPVDRPHLEGVGRAVVEAGHRIGGFGGADGDPGLPPVDPVLVIGDLRAAVARRSLPGQHDLAVPAYRRQVRRRIGHGQPRRGWRRWWWRWRRRWDADGPLEINRRQPRLQIRSR